MSFSAVIVAAGAGSRAGPGAAKQWRPLGGQPLVRWSVGAMISAGATEVVVVAPPGQEGLATEALAGLEGWRPASGGATRAMSVARGLASLEAEAESVVFVHDAARPFLATAHVHALLQEVRPGRGAILALPVNDTLKRESKSTVGAGLRTVDRRGLWRAQTPQAFPLGQLLCAYASWPAAENATDDAQVFERAGGEIALVSGDPLLFKLTQPEDFAMAERLARGGRATRVGFGFDAHSFGEGQSVMLCGVSIPHDRGLVGHSDADVGLHALTDALLGAIGAGDIGDHFPPGDPKWHGSPSSAFVEHAVALIDFERGSDRQRRHYADLRGASYKAVPRDDARAGGRAPPLTDRSGER